MFPKKEHSKRKKDKTVITLGGRAVGNLLHGENYMMLPMFSMDGGQDRTDRGRERQRMRGGRERDLSFPFPKGYFADPSFF